MEIVDEIRKGNVLGVIEDEGNGRLVIQVRKRMQGVDSGYFRADDIPDMAYVLQEAYLWLIVEQLYRDGGGKEPEAAGNDLRRSLKRKK